MDRILVPLDGSELSEKVLPYVVPIANSMDAQVTLLQAITDPIVDFFGEAPAVWDDLDDVRKAVEDSAKNYLNEAASRLQSAGVAVQTYAKHGLPGEVILGYAKEHSVSLIAMSTHGRTGLRRIILGSIAGRILQSADVPVLLVRPDEESLTEPRLSKMLIPLDMSQHGEAVIDDAVELAKRMGLQLTLAMSVPNLSQLYLGTEPVAYPTNVLEVMEQSVRDYLQEQARRIEEQEGISVEWKALEGDPGRAVVACAEEMGDTLIAMSTHGRSGLGRWVLGSVTDSVVRTSKAPVLVVRPSS